MMRRIVNAVERRLQQRKMQVQTGGPISQGSIELYRQEAFTKVVQLFFGSPVLVCPPGKTAPFEDLA